MPAISSFASEIKIISNDSPAQFPSNLTKWSITSQDVVIDLNGVWEFESEQSKDLLTITVPFYWEQDGARILVNRDFILPEYAPNRSWKLLIDGLHGYVALKLNGQHIDARRGVGISVLLDLQQGQLLYEGRRNIIELTLDNSTFRSGVMPLEGGIYAEQNIGGIIGGIYLIGAPPISINDLTSRIIRSTGDDTTTIAVNIELKASGVTLSRDSTLLVQVSLFDANANIVVKSERLPVDITQGGIQYLETQLTVVKPNKWDINGHPYLYKLVAELSGFGIEHSSSLDIGIHSFDVTDTGFKINGQDEFLRVLSYRSPPAEGNKFINDRRLRDEVAFIKALGVHAIRITHGAVTPQLLDLCDEHGILVFEELQVFQVPDPILSEADFIRAATEQLTAMINRDKGHVSIVAWGIGSELNQPNSRNREYYIELVSMARALDNRAVYASIPMDSEFQVAPLDFIILDVAEYTDTYSSSLPSSIEGDRPALVGGIRRAIVPGNLGGYADQTSESGQAEYILSSVRQAEENRWCSGVVVGDFGDWMGAVPSISGPLKGNSAVMTTGLVTPNLYPRLSYTRLKEYWRTGEVAPLTRGNPQPVKRGIFVGIGLGLLFVLVGSARQNNLFRLNLMRSFASARNFFQDVSDQRYFQNGHTILLAALISGGGALVTSSWLHANRGSYQLDWLLGQLMGGIDSTPWIAALIWEPLRGFLFCWLCIFILFWIMGLITMILSHMLGRSCTYSQSLNFVTWSGIGGVVIIPVGMLSRQIFESGSGWIVWSVVIFVMFWSFLRLMAALKRYLKRPYHKIVTFWLSGPIATLIIVLILLQYYKHFSLYWTYFWGTIF